MNDFEKELKETLKTKCDIGISKDDARRKEIEKMIFQKYTSDMNKAKIITWIFLILCVGAPDGRGHLPITRVEPLRFIS